MNWRRGFAGTGVLAGAGAAIVAGAFFWWSRHGLPQRAGEARIAGLRAAVEIRFDDAAVPHVRAESLADLARAVGWLHANERLGQMELARRHVAGRLSERIGPATVARDVAMRRLQLARTAERMAAELSDESRAVLEAYAAGVDAWVASRDGDLPPDLVLLGGEIEPWRIEDSLGIALAMAETLSHSAARDLRRLRWFVELSPERARDLLGRPQAEVDGEVLALAEPFRDDGASPRLDPLDAVEVQDGSNNWAVAASRTERGGALVANDPHLQLGLPPLWYQAHLRCPEYEAGGFTLPGLPIVVIGQGPRVAWGFTNTELDVCDVFLERVGADGRSVERDGELVPLEIEEELVLVDGAEPVEVEIATSDIGPFHAATAETPAYSLAWTGHAAFDPLAPFLRLARAGSVADVEGAIEGCVSPVQNLVCGDAGGAILFTVLGRGVERPYGDGSLPLPAWRRDRHWKGLAPRSHAPRSERPASGVLVTANHDTRPSGFAFDFPLDPAPEHRARRIEQRLLERDDWTADSLAELQVDATSLYAREVVESLGEPGPGASEAARRALECLRGWDGTMDGSGAAALYALLERRLDAGIFVDDLFERDLPRLTHPERSRALLDVLQGRLREDWFDDRRTAEVETRRATIETALARAWNDGRGRWGDDPARWSYGELHRWRPGHSLGIVPVLGRFFERPARGVPGSDTTPCVFSGRWVDEVEVERGRARFRGGEIEVGHGASLRLVADCADPDRSLAVLPGGQAGHPFDEHYDDQLELHLAGELRRMRWSEAAIEAATRSRLVLAP